MQLEARTIISCSDDENPLRRENVMRGTHRQMQSIPLAFRQELPVTVFRHPLRSRQMAVVNTPSPL